MSDQAIGPALENITTSTQLPANTLSGDLDFILHAFSIPLAFLKYAGIYLGLLIVLTACVGASCAMAWLAITLTRRHILRRSGACSKHEDEGCTTEGQTAIGGAYFMIMFAILVFGGWKDLTYARFALLGPAILASELIVALVLIVLVGIAQIVGLADHIREHNEQYEKARLAALKRKEDNEAAKKEDEGPDRCSDGEAENTELLEV